MANKKKTKLKKKTSKKSPARKKSTKSTKSTKARSTRRKPVAAKRAKPKKTAKAAKSGSRRTPKRSTRRPSEPTSEPRASGLGRAQSRRGQSGDLEGLSTLQGADSESVEELMDEGNTFEAGIIAGVERAGDSQREVHTREIPEDDVPQEYLDED